MILARYIEPGERDCERAIHELLGVPDREDVVAGRGLLPPRNSAEPDLPPMSSDKRPQDPTMDGRDMRFEG
ncbi:hypothetical protein QCM80_45790 [Bradyrhizobium sp. SSUT112]|uniref:hypothetical protein n=1 Tax=Bradyrhizobium sp. SSUT112 TaxID=3040604 RepID=UPI00244A8C9C|nr:hypothetical protein [Bradyrhizobium sp. SSUT112]MDH2357763.1 hypothetical protein [Bradyrhizobium sp. SSUT112]